jgi:hypothetical protein
MPSRVISSFDYDAERNELTVQFVSGLTYVYSLVPPEMAVRLRSAFSKGAFFNREIRDRYPMRVVAAGRTRAEG